MPGAAQTHEPGDLLEQLLWGAKLVRYRARSSNLAEMVWIGARQPRGDGRIRPQRDRIAGRGRLVVLRDGEILVDDGAPLEDVVADDSALFEPYRDRHCPEGVRELAAEPPQRS